MLLLICSGLIVLAELCALSYHEARRNRRSLSYLELQHQWYRQEQREAADQQMSIVFPVPKPVSSTDALDSIALLASSRTANRWADVGERLM